MTIIVVMDFSETIQTYIHRINISMFYFSKSNDLMLITHILVGKQLSTFLRKGPQLTYLQINLVRDQD